MILIAILALPAFAHAGWVALSVSEDDMTGRRTISVFGDTKEGESTFLEMYMVINDPNDIFTQIQCSDKGAG